MPLLKVGKNNIDTDKIANIITPITVGNHDDAAVIRWVWGAEQTFLGEEAATIRAWLASQTASPEPNIVTKGQPAKSSK